MREDAIVVQLKTEIENATASGVDVRTTGGDQDVDPPEVIIDWDSTRLSDENGHNSFGGYLTDASGNKTGIEHHSYWRFEADCRIRSYEELERDQMLDSVQMAFLPYEKSSEDFDSDTAEWEVGNGGPRENPIIENDWYESGVLVGFKYLKRADETGRDYIDTIQKNVDVDESLDDSSSQSK